jgi:hypothetical protein
MTQGLFGLETQGSISPLVVAEKKFQTLPRVRICHFNIARIAWGYLEAVTNDNAGVDAVVILNSNSAFDFMSMGSRVDVAVVMLRRGGGGGGKTR